MRNGWLLKSLACLVIPLAVPPAARPAEFDIDANRVVLRRLQFCRYCGAALLVTRLPAGALARCPDCGYEQPRLSDEFLLTQAYQLCRLCETPLDPEGRRPGETVECPLCHTGQILSRDAFPSGAGIHGLGYAPGFPPGSGRKRLLFPPDAPEAPLAPIPLDETSQPAAAPDHGVAGIPGPPALHGLDASVRQSGAPPETAVSGSAIRETASEPPPIRASSAGTEGPAPDRPAGNIAARVDGAVILRSEADRVLASARRRILEKTGGIPTGERERALRGEILDRLIDRELAIREAAALGRHPDPSEVKRREAELARLFPPGSGVDCRREAERDVIMADMRRLFAEKPGSAAPQAVRDYYREQMERLQRPRLLALDQLTVYQERAGRADRRPWLAIVKDISDDLERGGSFAELKAARGEFAEAALDAGEAPPLLPEAAYASGILAAAGDLRRGAVFGPVFLEGLALFGKVMDERPAGPVPFAEVEREIRLRLEAAATERNLDAWLKRLRQKARVEIF